MVVPNLENTGQNHCILEEHQEVRRGQAAETREIPENALDFVLMRRGSYRVKPGWYL